MMILEWRTEQTKLSFVPLVLENELSKKNILAKTHILLCFSRVPRTGWINWPIPDHLTLPQSYSSNLACISNRGYFGLHLSPCFISQVVQSPGRKEGCYLTVFQQSNVLIYCSKDCSFSQFWLKRAALIWAS